MTNPVVRWQLISPNPDANARFLRELFGWGISQDNTLAYREVVTGGLDGGIWPGQPNERPFVQLFVAVPDVQASLQRAEELGGTTIVPRTVLPDGDVMAIIQDPAGLTLGVCTLRER